MIPQVDLLATIQTNSTVAIGIDASSTAAISEYIPLLVAAASLLAALLMLYYARQLNRWTRQQFYPALVWTRGQAMRYKIMPNRIEVKLKFVNPGASLISVVSRSITKWDGEDVDLSPGWGIAEGDDQVRTGTPVGPYQHYETTIVIPFSALPSPTTWKELQARLGSTGDGIGLVAEVEYLTGPDGRSSQTFVLCFRLWGDMPAADGNFIGIQRVECGKAEG